MTLVKAEFPATQTHAPMLMGLLLRQVRAIFATEDWDELRQSHFRVMFAVPEQGVSITELGERVGMTKQGCGQFVTHLVETGHLATEPSAREQHHEALSLSVEPDNPARRLHERCGFQVVGTGDGSHTMLLFL